MAHGVDATFLHHLGHRCIISQVERTQISLTTEQGARLRRLALKRGTSMAALIREAVDQVHAEDASDSAGARWRRALDAAGAFAGDGKDAAREHDAYLEDAFRG